MSSSSRVNVVSFDCYGTLVDWLYGIRNVLKYALGEEGLEEFFECERDGIKMFKPYSTILKSCLRKLAERRGVEYREDYGRALVVGFAKSPPFPDTVPGLLALKAAGYTIAIISNTERGLIDLTLRGFEDLVDYVVTAEDTGYYKPDQRAFTKAFELIGVSKDSVVHVSSYPYYDLEPAAKLGVRTVLVDRYGYDWTPKVRTLEEAARLIIRGEI